VSIGYIICFYDVMFWWEGQPYNPMISAILYPLKKLIWSANLSVIIWLCTTGNGGFINTFLSANIFIPLSRLTYSVYLTHAWIVWMFWASRRDLVDINFFSIISIYLTVLIVSYLVGAVFSLLFEAPFLKFQSYLKKYFLDYNQNCKAVNKNGDTFITDIDLNQNFVSKL
jgi:peptidoglycan/LPS O-acetylase OafA/YrhL